MTVVELQAHHGAHAQPKVISHMLFPPHLQGCQQSLTQQLLGSGVGHKGQAGQHLQACQLALVLGGANEGQHGSKHPALYDLVAGDAVVLP